MQSRRRTRLSPRTTFHLSRQHGATLYSIQLGLNLVWMPTFFKFKQPALAAADIVSLLGVTSYLTYTWGQVDEVAGWALVPYLAWLGFATYLNVRTVSRYLSTIVSLAVCRSVAGLY